MPISGIISGDWVFAAFLSDGKMCISKIIVQENSGTYVDGMYYFSMHIEGDDSTLLESVNISRYCVLLPSSSLANKYTMVTSDWNTWDKECSITMPYTFLNSNS